MWVRADSASLIYPSDQVPGGSRLNRPAPIELPNDRDHTVEREVIELGAPDTGEPAGV
jgi:hypothetical protein